MKLDRPVWLAGAAIALAALAAYHNSFGVPFLFDDEPSILQNESIRSFATAFNPPGSFGFTVSGRPLLNLSLALNHAISGTGVWSYHALNLLIHVLAGLTLFGLVRRTVALPALKGRFAGLELSVAFMTALLWVLHPLQTESVTYVVQRAESLMGLFYLLTLYGFVRAASAAPARGWQVFTVIACALGMACKEVMVTAPVVAVLYDRTFLAGSFRAVWMQRRGIHGWLFATWLPLAWLVASGGDRGGTFDLTPAAFTGYWLTQFEAVARYLQLALWPAPLVFEYGVTKVGVWTEVLPYAVPVIAVFAAMLWALRRRPVAGFLGAAFFLILAPTSLMPGVTQTMVEHRMYLPLAAVITLVVGAVLPRLGWRAGWAVFLTLALVAGGLTVRRNAVYQDELGLWLDTVAKRPSSAKAQNNLGRVHFHRGELAEARRRYEIAVSLDPGSAQTRYNLGLVLDATGQPEAAIAQYGEAVRILPYFAQAKLRAASALLRLGRPADAIAPAAEATRLLVEPAEAYFTLGQAQAMLGRPAEAVESYRTAVRHEPAHAEARLNLGILLAQSGRMTEALVQLDEAARLRPQLPEAHANLGIVLAESDRLPEAIASYQRALDLRPGYAAAHYNLGNALLRLGRVEEARGHFIAAVEAAPDFEAAREMLERLR